MNAQTILNFNLTGSEQVIVSITDQSGRTIREVLNESMAAGKHQIVVESADLTAGEYFVVLRTGFHSQILKLRIRN